MNATSSVSAKLLASDFVLPDAVQTKPPKIVTPIIAAAVAIAATIVLHRLLAGTDMRASHTLAGGLE